jgi:hypothetical protein
MGSGTGLSFPHEAEKRCNKPAAASPARTRTCACSGTFAESKICELLGLCMHPTRLILLVHVSITACRRWALRQTHQLPKAPNALDCEVCADFVCGESARQHNLLLWEGKRTRDETCIFLLRNRMYSCMC